MSKRMSAREAMAIAEVYGAWTGHDIDALELWRAEQEGTRAAFRYRATNLLKLLRRLGFTIVALPKRRKAGRK